ncbi:MAG: hypothetical protein NT121_02915 [Chloroflexi bacterium]|nr:hypothetical protein [Chloroflexota bacterium]
MKIRFMFFLMVTLLVTSCRDLPPEVVTPTNILFGKPMENSTDKLTITPSQTKTKILPTSTITLTPEKLSAPLMLWKGSPHANTYNLSKGVNTYCAKCHSPFNWDPKARIGTAPNCVSCKLRAEKEPRISKQNPLVLLSDWKSINCKVCHETDGNEISPTVAWWNQELGKYEFLSDSTALCNKCHIDTKKMSHRIELKDSAHSGFECLDCHDPHSTAASCSNSGCHDNVRAPGKLSISTPVVDHGQVGATDCDGPSCHVSATQVALSNSTIHGVVHSSVACIACHVSGGGQVGRSEVDGAWGIYQTVEMDGNLLTYPSNSHGITRQVDCTRCHFDGNPWKLLLVTGHEFGQ